MTEADLKQRTKRFAVDVVNFVDRLPRERVTEHIARQVLRSGTSVAANYRAACRGRSDAEMAAKLGIVEEEADETQFWLELLVDTGRVEPQSIQALIHEADALLRIIVSSIKTLRGRSSASCVRESNADYDVAPWGEDEFGFPQSTIHNPQ